MSLEFVATAAVQFIVGIALYGQKNFFWIFQRRTVPTTSPLQVSFRNNNWFSFSLSYWKKYPASVLTDPINPHLESSICTSVINEKLHEAHSVPRMWCYLQRIIGNLEKVLSNPLGGAFSDDVVYITRPSAVMCESLAALSTQFPVKRFDSSKAPQEPTVIWTLISQRQCMRWDRIRLMRCYHYHWKLLKTLLKITLIRIWFRLSNYCLVLFCKQWLLRYAQISARWFWPFY